MTVRWSKHASHRVTQRVPRPSLSRHVLAWKARRLYDGYEFVHVPLWGKTFPVLMRERNGALVVVTVCPDIETHGDRQLQKLAARFA